MTHRLKIPGAAVPKPVICSWASSLKRPHAALRFPHLSMWAKLPRVSRARGGSPLTVGAADLQRECTWRGAVLMGPLSARRGEASDRRRRVSSSRCWGGGGGARHVCPQSRDSCGVTAQWPHRSLEQKVTGFRSPRCGLKRRCSCELTWLRPASEGTGSIIQFQKMSPCSSVSLRNKTGFWSCPLVPFWLEPLRPELLCSGRPHPLHQQVPQAPRSGSGTPGGAKASRTLAAALTTVIFRATAPLVGQESSVSQGCRANEAAGMWDTGADADGAAATHPPPRLQEESTGGLCSRDLTVTGTSHVRALTQTRGAPAATAFGRRGGRGHWGFSGVTFRRGHAWGSDPTSMRCANVS